MTQHNLLLDSFESLWHYGLPSSPPPITSQISSSTASTTTPSIFICTHTSFCSTSCPLADAGTLPGSLRRLFNVLDEDGDGRLSLREMCSLVAKLGMSNRSDNLLSLIHSTLDMQHPNQQISGTHDAPSLDFPQFAQMYASLFAPSHQDSPTEKREHEYQDEDDFDDEFLDAFQVYDRNRDGFISAAELAAVLLELGLLPAGDDEYRGLDAHLGTCQAYIESMDLDGNGMVDLQEFKAMMMHNIPSTNGRNCCSISCCASSKITGGIPLTCKT